MEDSLNSLAGVSFEGFNFSKKTFDNSKKASEATKKSAKEQKLASYIGDSYASVLEYINIQLAKQNSITSQFPKHSSEYRQSLKAEISLLKEKGKVLENQAKDLEKQIKSGRVSGTGIVQSSGGKSSKAKVSNSPSSDVARYYLDGFRVTSPFGMRTHPTTGGRKMHSGVDLSKGRAGDPVKAVRSGKVITATFS